LVGLPKPVACVCGKQMSLPFREASKVGVRGEGKPDGGGESSGGNHKGNAVRGKG